MVQRKKEEEEQVKQQRKRDLEKEKELRRDERKIINQAKTEANKLRKAEEANMKNAKKLIEQKKKVEEAKKAADEILRRRIEVTNQCTPGSQRSKSPAIQDADLEDEHMDEPPDTNSHDNPKSNVADPGDTPMADSPPPSRASSNKRTQKDQTPPFSDVSHRHKTRVGIELDSGRVLFKEREDISDEDIESFFETGGEAERIAAWVAGEKPQRKPHPINQPKQKGNEAEDAQATTMKQGEENEIITVDSTSTADDTSGNAKRTGDEIPKDKPTTPPIPQQQAPPKIAAFQVTRKDTSISNKPPFIFGSIPEATPTNTAPLTSPSLTSIPPFTKATRQDSKGTGIIPESVSVAVSTPSHSTTNSTITSSPSLRQSSYKGVPHGHIATNNVPNETGRFVLPPPSTTKRGWITVGIKKQADEDNKDVVLQGTQATMQVLQAIDPSVKILVQQEGITLPPLHSTRDEDWPTMFGILSAFFYVPNHWSLKFPHTESQPDGRPPNNWISGNFLCESENMCLKNSSKCASTTLGRTSRLDGKKSR